MRDFVMTYVLGIIATLTVILSLVNMIIMFERERTQAMERRVREEVRERYERDRIRIRQEEHKGKIKQEQDTRRADMEISAVVAGIANTLYYESAVDYVRGIEDAFDVPASQIVNDMRDFGRTAREAYRFPGRFSCRGHDGTDTLCPPANAETNKAYQRCLAIAGEIASGTYVPPFPTLKYYQRPECSIRKWHEGLKQMRVGDHVLFIAETRMSCPDCSVS